MPVNLTIIALGAIVVGVVQCFFGYRIFRIILGVTGFFLGGLAGGYLAFGLTQSQFGAIVGGLIGGLIGAALMAGLYIVGVFLIGALFGAMVALAVLSLGGGSPATWIVVIAALAGGVLAALLQKVIIILATAFGGAWWMLTGVATLAGVVSFESVREWLGALASAPFGWLIGWLVLGVVGLFFQYRRART
jgi:hypothetical protein